MEYSISVCKNVHLPDYTGEYDAHTDNVNEQGERVTLYAKEMNRASV